MKILLAVIVAAAHALSVVATTHQVSSAGGSWTVTDVTYPPGGPLFFGISPQGVAHDPASGTLIFSGKDALHEVSVTNVSSRSDDAAALGTYNFTTVRFTWPLLLPALTSQGYDHAGDVDYIPSARQLLIPIEEPTYTRPIIAVANRTATGFEIVRYANATGQKHCPWVAFAPFSEQAFFDLVLSSEFDNVTTVSVLRWPSMEVFGKYRLHQIGENGLMHVQGGVVHNFNLYLSTDQNVNPNGDDLFAFDLTAVVHAEGPTAPLVGSWKRKFTDGVAETEGLTIDAADRMWVVTNVLIDDAIYTLQRS